MSGIDKSRLVGVSDRDVEAFTCGICQDLLADPVVTPCCRQTYCSRCICHWLRDHRTCPNDRRRLSAGDLSPASRLVTNWLNDLKVKCDFETNGCGTVVPIHRLSKHIQNCGYNPNNYCESCGLRKDIDCEHNCIEKLKIRNQSLNDENKRLKTEMLCLKREIDEFRTNYTNNGVFGSNDVRQLADGSGEWTGISRRKSQMSETEALARLRMRSINRAKNSDSVQSRAQSSTSLGSSNVPSSQSRVLSKDKSRKQTREPNEPNEPSQESVSFWSSLGVNLDHLFPTSSTDSNRRPQEAERTHPGANLFIKNLEKEIDHKMLWREFRPFGQIISSRVMYDESKRSKGFGFVCYLTPEAATRAVIAMNNRTIVCGQISRKPLYVGLAQKKDERQLYLADKHRQSSDPGMGSRELLSKSQTNDKYSRIDDSDEDSI